MRHKWKNSFSRETENEVHYAATDASSFSRAWLRGADGSDDLARMQNAAHSLMDVHCSRNDLIMQLRVSHSLEVVSFDSQLTFECFAIYGKSLY